VETPFHSAAIIREKRESQKPASGMKCEDQIECQERGNADWTGYCDTDGTCQFHPALTEENMWQ